MTDIPDGKMICQVCGGDGEHLKLHLVGDGQPNTETRLEDEWIECHCENGFIDDPEA